MKNIELGQYVRDTVTGFRGIAFARAEYLTGCHQVLVKPRELKADGEPIDPHWLDEPRLVVEDHRPVMVIEPGLGLIDARDATPRPRDVSGCDSPAPRKA